MDETTKRMVSSDRAEFIYIVRAPVSIYFDVPIYGIFYVLKRNAISIICLSILPLRYFILKTDI